MIFSQTLGKVRAKKLKKPKGKNAVSSELRRNLDIKKAVDSFMRAYKPKTNKQRDVARQRAILKAMKRNKAFQSAVKTALTVAISE
jgi:hypothetical protein